MGVTGDAERIGQYGEMFRAIPGREPVLPTQVMFGPDLPMSAGMADVQNLKAFCAAEFARAKDEGIVAAGDALVLVAANLAEIDRQGAGAIARLLPDRAADAGEGSR